MEPRRRSLFGFTPPNADQPRDEGGERPRALSVSDLNALARRELERGFSDLRVAGEMSGIYESGPGHLYFTLKDAKAEVSAVMWRTRTRGLGFRPENGLAVEVRGRLSLYEPRGRFQLIVDEMDLAGLGELERRFRALKERYRAAGWFEAELKQALPFLPRRIGIVTSVRGAALRDILKTIDARFRRARILVHDARVQGAGAAEEIAAGIEALDAHPEVDVIIAGRGGGSLEDLWAFNEPAVVEAIHACATPLVSAVGHEVDVSLADLVADLRVATPTAAAAAVLPNLEEIETRLLSAGRRLDRETRGRLRELRQRLEALQGSWALREPAALVARAGQRLDEAERRLQGALTARCREARRQVEGAEIRLRPHLLSARLAASRFALESRQTQLEDLMRERLGAVRRALDDRERLLRSLSPLTVLERGYSITRDAATGEILRDPAEVRAGQEIESELAGGRLRSRVKAEDEGPRDATQSD
jgi:exodeoxyribonuclease VII large subunit